jgi:hypothetical protein
LRETWEPGREPGRNLEEPGHPDTTLLLELLSATLLSGWNFYLLLYYLAGTWTPKRKSGHPKNLKPWRWRYWKYIWGRASVLPKHETLFCFFERGLLNVERFGRELLGGDLGGLGHSLVQKTSVVSLIPAMERAMENGGNECSHNVKQSATISEERRAEV